MHIPVKDQHFTTIIAEVVLANSNGDWNIVENTEPRGCIAFRMMAWWTDYSDGISDISANYSSTSFDSATCCKLRALESAVVKIDGITCICEGD
jgi:hypothetical protein